MFSNSLLQILLQKRHKNCASEVTKSTQIFKIEFGVLLFVFFWFFCGFFSSSADRVYGKNLEINCSMHVSEYQLLTISTCYKVLQFVINLAHSVSDCHISGYNGTWWQSAGNIDIGFKIDLWKTHEFSDPIDQGFILSLPFWHHDACGFGGSVSSVSFKWLLLQLLLFFFNFFS